MVITFSFACLSPHTVIIEVLDSQKSFFFSSWRQSLTDLPGMASNSGLPASASQLLRLEACPPFPACSSCFKVAPREPCLGQCMLVVSQYWSEVSSSPETSPGSKCRVNWETCLKVEQCTDPGSFCLVGARLCWCACAVQPVSDIPQVCLLRDIQDALDFSGLCSVLAGGSALTTMQVSCLSRPDQGSMSHAQADAT